MREIYCAQRPAAQAGRGDAIRTRTVRLMPVVVTLEVALARRKMKGRELAAEIAAVDPTLLVSEAVELAAARMRGEPTEPARETLYGEG